MLLAPGLAQAEHAPIILAPAAGVLPAPKQAAVFDLQMRLPEGRGLAKLLLQAGVDQTDAGEAARIAAGHLGDGTGGCIAKVAVSRGAADTFLRIERVTLVTQTDQTVIDRRDGELTIVDQSRSVINRARIA